MRNASLLCFWALALTGWSQEAPDRPPELTGKVVSAIADGSSALLTLRVTGGTLRDRTSEALVYLQPDTKTVYCEVPLRDRTPAANMSVQVWLREGSRDQAVFVRLALEEKALPRPPEPPPPPPPPAPPPPAVVALEAEEMNLREVEVKELAGASRGKAISFTRPNSRAKASVKLKKGSYEVQVQLQARKMANDAVIVRLAGQELRLVAEPAGTLAPGRPRDGARASVAIPGDGEFELRVEFSAPDVFVDRVVLSPEATPDEEGFIRKWRILAPLPAKADPLKDEAGLRPREGDRHADLAWRTWESGEFLVNFNRFVGKPTAQAAGYAVCLLVSREELKDLELRMASDDDGQVFLNGKDVLRHQGPRTAQKDLSRAKGLTLRKGENLLVFKVVNGEAEWQGAVRFVRADGRPVTDLVVSLP